MHQSFLWAFLAVLLSLGTTKDCASKNGTVHVSANPYDGVFAIGVTAVLICWSSLNKTTFATWYFEEQAVSSEDPKYTITRTSAGSKLFIGLLNASDAGVYVCEINDECGNATISVVDGLTVLPSPDIKVYQGNDVTLKVAVLFQGDVSVRWTFNGTELKEEKDSVNERKTFQFRISNVNASNQGVYNVTVVSLQKVFTESVGLTLTIIRPPSAPMDVKCMPQPSGSLLVIWKSIQENSFEQDVVERYLVTYVEAGSNETARAKYETAGSQTTEISHVKPCATYTIGVQAEGSFLRSGLKEDQCTVPPIYKNKVFQSGGVVYMTLTTTQQAIPVCLSPHAYRQYSDQRRHVCSAALDLEKKPVYDRENGYMQINLQVNASRDFIGMITKECPFNIVEGCPSDHFLNLSLICNDLQPEPTEESPPNEDPYRVIAGSVGGTIGVIVLVICVACYKKRRRKAPKEERDCVKSADHRQQDIDRFMEAIDMFSDVVNKWQEQPRNATPHQTQSGDVGVHEPLVGTDDVVQQKSSNSKEETSFSANGHSVERPQEKALEREERIEETVTRLEKVLEGLKKTTAYLNPAVLESVLKNCEKLEERSAAISQPESVADKAMKKPEDSSLSAAISQPVSQESVAEKAFKKPEDSPLSAAAATGGSANGDSLAYASLPLQSMKEESIHVSSGAETEKNTQEQLAKVLSGIEEIKKEVAKIREKQAQGANEITERLDDLSAGVHMQKNIEEENGHRAFLRDNTRNM